jgi:hypothetical protein
MDQSPKPTLIKTCNTCGLSKPLSAFLQLSATNQAIYGNTCSACRKANKDKPIIPPTEEGSTSSKIGLKIDAKTKVKSDTDRKLFQEHIQEVSEKEREDKNIVKKKRIEKRQLTAKKERSHREGYLKKASFLQSKPKVAPLPGGVAERGFANKEKARQHIDYTKPLLDTQITGKIKHQSSTKKIFEASIGKPRSVFQTFRAWAGKAPIVKNVEKMGLIDKRPAPIVKQQQPTQQPTEKPEKTWSPTSRKR